MLRASAGSAKRNPPRGLPPHRRVKSRRQYNTNCTLTYSFKTNCLIVCFKQTTGGSKPALRLGRFVEAKSSISSELLVLPAPEPGSFRGSFGAVSRSFGSHGGAQKSMDSSGDLQSCFPPWSDPQGAKSRRQYSTFRHIGTKSR